MYQSIGFHDVAQIGGCGNVSALEVVVGVVAHTVSAAFYLLEEFGMAAHVLTDAEKSGFDAVVVERVEHPRGNLGNRSVVESEIDTLFLLSNAPHPLGE